MSLATAVQRRRWIWLVLTAVVIAWALLQIMVQRFHLQEREQRMALQQHRLQQSQQEKEELKWAVKQAQIVWLS